MTDFPLSKDDLIKSFNGKVKVLLYSDLKNIKNVKELLSPYNRVIILYFWRKLYQ